MNSLTLASPAKLNLALYVVGREKTGYHRLVTLFHRLSLHDTIRLQKRRQGFRLQCSEPNLSTGNDNIIFRAYELLRRKLPDLKGVSISLSKRIPIGGGLGGGSSNAAMFLVGMKKLYRLRIPFSELLAIGKKLGADVPFFMYDINQAIGKGRGDSILSRPEKRRLWFLLLIDRKGLSTKKVYHGLPSKLRVPSLTKVMRTVKILSSFLDKGDLVQVGRILHNDLKSSAFRLRPSIQRKINRLKRLGVKAVGMSGSGPTVFGIFSLKRELKSFFDARKGDPVLGKMVICHTF